MDVESRNQLGTSRVSGLGGDGRMRAVALLAALALSCGALSSVSQSAFAAGAFTLESSFGSPGEALGQLEGPGAMTVDARTGDVLVVDAKNERIEKFEPRGEGAYTPIAVLTSPHGSFKLKPESGVAVDNSTGASAGDVYVASGKYVYQFKPQAGSPSGYEATATVLESQTEEIVHGLAVDANGDVYVTFGASLSVFSPTGEELSPGPQPVSSVVQDVAVTGSVVYLATASGLERSELNAEHRLNQETTIAQMAGSKLEAVTVGYKGQVYADLREGHVSHIAVFAADAQASSTPVEVFGIAGQIGESYGLAYSSHGAVPTMLVGDATSDEVRVYAHVAPPEVSSCEATSTTSSATVACTITPEAVQATWKLDYRPSLGSFSEVLGGTITATGQVGGEVTGLEPAREYVYRLSAANANGEASFEAPFVTKPIPPLVGASGASNVLARTATLSGTVNPHNSPTFYRFEYGPCADAASCATSPYTYETPQASAGSGHALVAVSEAVKELEPQTTYHYRVDALDAAGEAVSGEQLFTTGSLSQAEALTGPASDITQTGAAISGAVNPNGQATTFTWQLGTSTSYGTSVSGSAGAEAAPESVSLAVTALLPDTTYHYRLLATNRSGTVYGADETFTTLSYGTEPLIAPASPVLLPATPMPVPVTQEGTEPSGGVKAFKAKLTTAQLLSKALKACHRQAQSKRATCERQARKKYGKKGPKKT
jgi:hypothetical protein